MSASTAELRPAAFYDVDGTLVETNIVHVYLYYAMRLPKLKERLGRMLRFAFLSPAYAVAELMSRALFNRFFYTSYRGIPRERLTVMGRELAEQALMLHLYADARKRIRQANEMGLMQVIVSGSLDSVMLPFAGRLGFDHVIANRLEFEEDRATGRLVPPVLAGPQKRRVIEDFARDYNVDLTRSYAFADSYSDLAMLEAVGFPCAVNPDQKLRTIAEERGWPILAFA